jgi:hypothetical protein
MWVEIEDGRVSFRYRDLPEDVHFTLSWKNEDNINFHVTRNTADSLNKPKIPIVKWDREFADRFSPFIPALVLRHLFTPASFGNYSRSSRKNIRVIFFDELEQNLNHFKIYEKATAVFKQYSSIKGKKKLRINPAIAHSLQTLLTTGEISSLLFSHVRALKRNTFNSPTPRSGIIIGHKMHTFIAHKNQCYLLNERKSLPDLLKIFMKPELIEGLTNKIIEAIAQIKQAKDYEGIRHLDTPYQLYLET